MDSGTALAGTKGPATRSARAVSLVFQPMLTAVYLLFIVSFISADSPASAVAWAAALSTLTAGMPALDLAIRLRTGRIGDFQMVLRQERLGPLLVALLWSGLGLALALWLGAPEPLVVTLTVGVANGVLLTAITSMWKISFHTATIMSAVLVLAWYGHPVVLAATPLVALVGWSRVRLRRHTVAQTMAGAAVAGAVTGTMLGALG